MISKTDGLWRGFLDAVPFYAKYAKPFEAAIKLKFI
jgi:hypothetical protein